MRPASVMVVAGEASGDWLAANLVEALRIEMAARQAANGAGAQPRYASLEPDFFGAGGPRMAAAGVDLAFDMTAHSVIGMTDVALNYLKFRRLFRQLFNLAIERQPEIVICVDFSGFNRRLAHAIKERVRARRDWFHSWDPKLIQYVSPQVWASREGRAAQLARDYDLLLSIFPFEKDWYASRVPGFHVEFVGHPMLDRLAEDGSAGTPAPASAGSRPPSVLLLPGSRTAELSRHLPVMLEALARIRSALPAVRARMVLPGDALVRQAARFNLPPELETRSGGLPDALREADVAIASTGTVTMECAFYGVPTVALYKTSWGTYQIGKRIVKVKHIAMPNILAGETVCPEFIQDDATPENLARATLDLLQDDTRRSEVSARLRQVVGTLGTPGASRRAARAVVDTFMS